MRRLRPPTPARSGRDHTVDIALIVAADAVADYFNRCSRAQFKRSSCALRPRVARCRNEVSAAFSSPSTIPIGERAQGCGRQNCVL